jgi:hypothetical protein
MYYEKKNAFEESEKDLGRRITSSAYMDAFREGARWDYEIGEAGAVYRDLSEITGVITTKN